MDIVDKVMVEVWNIAQRGLDGTQTVTPLPAQTSTSSSSSTPTPTGGGGGGGGGGNSQSPLLFFVALGFGVVFTNLWIIVGVKYCFRYNARNRALARGEDGQPINLENMARPHRRRREKKLMTMDEVNERFPITKYKNWVAARASEGLPTAGGVATAPSSRAASLRDVDGVIPSSPVTSKHSDDRPETALSTNASPEVTVSPATNALGGATAADNRKSTDGVTEKTVDASEQPLPKLTAVDTAVTDARKSEDEEDDDDHIHGAIAPEMIADPGDSCAICIDTLEQDDDIRGLTCGHAFHAGCLDPWLTSRRACCPLCKADYFVPKPRPEGEAAEPERPRRTGMGRMAMPAQPRSAWTGIRGPRGMMLPGRFMANTMYEGPANETQSQRQRRLRQQRQRNLTPSNTNTLEPQATTATSATGEVTTSEHRTLASRITSPFHTRWMPSIGRRRQNETETGVGPQEPTPAQLEAGVVR